MPAPNSSAPTANGAPAGGWQPPTRLQEPEADSEQGRFDAFKPEADAQPTPEPAGKPRNLMVFLAVMAVCVALLAAAFGIVKLAAGDDAPAFEVAVGECVKKSGSTGEKVNCGEAGAFTVVSKVDNYTDCPDQQQPHLTVGEKVLCLKPAGT